MRAPVGTAPVITAPASAPTFAARRSDGPGPPSAGVAAGACLAIAAASLLAPATLTFDAWGWLVWGRELRRLALDTTGGPSWKPLPALVAAPLSLAGGATPALWMVTARAAGLMAVVGVFRLGERCAGRVAGLFAAALLLATPDGEARFVRLLLEGHTAPAEAALAVWALERGLAGRTRTTFALLTLLGLLRPEAWPFLIAYAAWTWWRVPSTRRLAIAATAVIPLLWFGGDWWGSGNAWHGADIAQVVGGDEATRLSGALERVGAMVVVPVWALAGVAIGAALRTRHRLTLVVGAAAVAWAAVVVAMCVTLGYAALSRFLLPSAALVCVLAAAGTARIVAAARAAPARALAITVVAAIVLGFAWARLASLDDLIDDGRTRARLDDDVGEAVESAGGAAFVLGCGEIAIDRSGLANAVLPALAWRLDVPLGRVRESLPGPTGVVIARIGTAQDSTFAESDSPGVRPLARSRHWAVYALGCDPSG